jgi:hypothetical protein
MRNFPSTNQIKEPYGCREAIADICYYYDWRDSDDLFGEQFLARALGHIIAYIDGVCVIQCSDCFFRYSQIAKDEDAKRKSCPH